MKDPKDKIASKAYINIGNFKKNFLPHLAYFEKLREWPDFCNWLQKVSLPLNQDVQIVGRIPLPRDT
jgi:hypothetical protein